MMPTISDGCGKELERTALRMVGSYAQYVLKEIGKE